VHPGAHALAFGAEAKRVVEVLGLLRVDREGDQIAKVDTRRLELRRLVRQGRRLAARPFLPEEALQDGLDVIGRAEDLLQPGAAAADAKHDQVADRCFPCTFAVDDDRLPAFEVGLADEELPAPGKLGDDQRHLRGE
jgi:hypothetical protein